MIQGWDAATTLGSGMSSGPPCCEHDGNMKKNEP